MDSKKLGRVLLSAAVLAACGAPGASAQAPPSYGGGLFRQLHPKTYEPYVGVTFEQRGEMLALRFDTNLKCGRSVYQTSAHRVVPLAGGHAQASGHGSFRLGRGRVRFKWKLTADVGPSAVSGVLDIRGARRRTGSCTHKPKRKFQALLQTPLSGAAAMPPPNALYLGLTESRVSGGFRGPVLLRGTANGKRVGARWSVRAPCGTGAPQSLVNFTPPTLVRPDGTFSRGERFKEVFSDEVVRFRVLFRGGFTSDGAAGQLRMRARIYDRKGKRLLTRCDTGLRPWTARGPASG
jgi:hypothetical protein